MVTDPQRAPGELEGVRALLNSEWIPNYTRVRRDDLAGFLKARRIAAADAEDLRWLRDALRRAIDRKADADATLTGALERLNVRLAVRKGRLSFDHESGEAPALLAAVLVAVRDGTWHRLKACPDCEWVFFDRSRNASKRWCVMQAVSEGGRSCGTLAKVREFRRRSNRSAARKRAR
jgi:predicted RNA-binding Zn ribbon-like protein